MARFERHAEWQFLYVHFPLGLDVTGPDIGKGRSSAKIETDFGGFSGGHTMLRIRQAYVNLDWGKSAVLVGITWHPLVCRDAGCLESFHRSAVPAFQP